MGISLKFSFLYSANLYRATIQEVQEFTLHRAKSNYVHSQPRINCFQDDKNQKQYPIKNIVSDKQYSLLDTFSLPSPCFIFKNQWQYSPTSHWLPGPSVIVEVSPIILPFIAYFFILYPILTGFLQVPFMIFISSLNINHATTTEQRKSRFYHYCVKRIRLHKNHQC